MTDYQEISGEDTRSSDVISVKGVLIVPNFKTAETLNFSPWAEDGKTRGEKEMRRAERYKLLKVVCQKSEGADQYSCSSSVTWADTN